MKKKQSYMKRKMRRERRIKRMITLCIYAILFLIIHSLNSENKELRNVIEDHNMMILVKEQEIVDLGYVIDELNVIIDNIDNQLKQVSTVNKSYVDELNELRKRSELYDKYEYAIVDNGKRTELTYEEIEYGEDLMLAKGYDPNLMFGSIMVESRANPNAVNKDSGATGYGQFLDSTAKWVWTRILGNDSYYSDIRKNGKANIQMMAAYYDHLYSIYDSTFMVVKRYSGNSTNEGTRKYLARVNSFVKTVGAVIN